MTPEARIAELEDRVRRLEDLPLSDHPEELDRIHQALVAELDALAEFAGGAPRR